MKMFPACGGDEPSGSVGKDKLALCSPRERGFLLTVAYQICTLNIKNGSVGKKGTMFNLLREKWLRVRMKNGEPRWIAPYAINDPGVLELAPPRPDFKADYFELLY